MSSEPLGGRESPQDHSLGGLTRHPGWDFACRQMETRGQEKGLPGVRGSKMGPHHNQEPAISKVTQEAAGDKCGARAQEKAPLQVLLPWARPALTV